MELKRKEKVARYPERTGFSLIMFGISNAFAVRASARVLFLINSVKEISKMSLEFPASVGSNRLVVVPQGAVYSFIIDTNG